jgi:hypothetical protein
MAVLEYEAAEYLRKMEFHVLGSHQKATGVRPEMLDEIKSKLLGFLCPDARLNL